MKTRKRSRLLAGLLVLVMVMTLMPAAAFAADPAANTVTATKVEVSNASDITAGKYLIYGISANTIDSKSGAFMSANGSTDTRLMSADITVTSGTASTADKNCIWNLIETTGGFYVQNAQTGRYLYYGSNSGNNIYQTSDAANAGVWVVFKNSNGWTLQETASMRELSCNRFGSAGSYYFGFAAYGSTSSTQRTLEFYKVAEDPYPDIDKKYSVYEKGI